jgi:hypothetical protein
MKQVAASVLNASFALASTLTLTADMPAVAQQAAPSIAAKTITRLPFVITKPGVYVMKRDFVFDSPTAAITCSAPHVTVDLGGFTLRNSGAYRDTTAIIAGASICIRNGTIRGFAARLTSEVLGVLRQSRTSRLWKAALLGSRQRETSSGKKLPGWDKKERGGSCSSRY